MLTLYCQTKGGKTFPTLRPATKITPLPAILPNIPPSMPDCIYAYTCCYAHRSASIPASKANALHANKFLYIIASMPASFIENPLPLCQLAFHACL
jgi:hypothetical protein